MTKDKEESKRLGITVMKSDKVVPEKVEAPKKKSQKEEKKEKFEEDSEKSFLRDED